MIITQNELQQKSEFTNNIAGNTMESLDFNSEPKSMTELTSGQNLYIGETNLDRFSKLKSQHIIKPELEGSEKQVIWANEIRDSWLSEFDRWVPEAAANVEYLAAKNRNASDRFAQFVESANKFVAGTAQIEHAATWIAIKSPPEIRNPHQEVFGKVLMEYRLRGGDPQTGGKKWSDFYQTK
jgi:hypothetical protein